MPQLETALDSALLMARVLQACSEVPVLNFLKPAASLAIVICETAKNVTGNVEAAKQLSERTANILDLVVDHLRQIPLTEVTADLERDAVKLYE
ncbi:hypothetical protein PILCRDRAFT_636853 [Piloderma croceum F 1598]|uniref:Uncharacterized protein n=1 Tax=Piloderma croceum (strain F 1598) TaxID=765440 RepID=A0A0C3FA51_PILCF|nr:hypothetical protein PILCRDRAFT_636853 [Piloderma croceum F 1598]